MRAFATIFLAQVYSTRVSRISRDHTGGRSQRKKVTQEEGHTPELFIFFAPPFLLLRYLA